MLQIPRNRKQQLYWQRNFADIDLINELHTLVPPQAETISQARKIAKEVSKYQVLLFPFLILKMGG